MLKIYVWCIASRSTYKMLRVIALAFKFIITVHQHRGEKEKNIRADMVKFSGLG